jgi:5-(carboxyamino)imidazole ribonucleotide synthase
MLGSGQLGRMFAVAAARIGYHVHVFSPEANSPAGQVAHRETVAPWEDVEALTLFARSVDVVTLEWENIPASAIEIVERQVPVRPGHDVLHITQHRLREKQFLTSAGIACAPFAEVNSLADLMAAIPIIGVPCVLKTAVAGYDGKGQIAIQAASEAEAAWDFINRQPAVLEGWINYRQELSVLVGRSATGAIANDHANHILDVSRLPAGELAPVAAEAADIGRTVAERLEMSGLCCVEMFFTDAGKLVVNEIAPRPHNSGHLTIEACCTSQFEQQVRAICGLPLGAMESRIPAAMVNLLGDLWQQDPSQQRSEPRWLELLSVPHGYLHLYGKTEAKPGRKMGHFTVLGENAAELAVAARRSLMDNNSHDQT